MFVYEIGFSLGKKHYKEKGWLGDGPELFLVCSKCFK